MSFFVILKYPEVFSSIVEILRELQDVITLDISQQGFSIVTVDSAHVFLIELMLPACTAFNSFQWPVNS